MIDLNCQKGPCLPSLHTQVEQSTQRSEVPTIRSSGPNWWQDVASVHQVAAQNSKVGYEHRQVVPVPYSVLLGKTRFVVLTSDKLFGNTI